MKALFHFIKKKPKLSEIKDNPTPFARGIKELIIKKAILAIHDNDLNTLKNLCQERPMLVNDRIPCNLTIFLYAVSFGKLSIVQYFLTLPQLDLNATQFNNWNYRWEGNSGLHLAIEQNYSEVAVTLIQAGIDTHIFKPKMCLYAIHLAAQKGNLEVIKALLVKDPTMLNRTDYFAQTPLMHAVMHGCANVVAYLLKQPDINVHAYANDYAMLDANKTALAFALENGHEECAKLLIQFSQNHIKTLFDRATHDYFPKELTNLIVEYDDQEPRMRR